MGFKVRGSLDPRAQKRVLGYSIIMYNSYSDFPWQQHFESFRSSIAGSRVRDFVVGDFGFGILEVPGLASHLLVLVLVAVRDFLSRLGFSALGFRV